MIRLTNVSHELMTSKQIVTSNYVLVIFILSREPKRENRFFPSIFYYIFYIFKENLRID